VLAIGLEVDTGAELAARRGLADLVVEVPAPASGKSHPGGVLRRGNLEIPGRLVAAVARVDVDHGDTRACACGDGNIRIRPARPPGPNLLGILRRIQHAVLRPGMLPRTTAGAIAAGADPILDRVTGKDFPPASGVLECSGQEVVHAA